MQISITKERESLDDVLRRKNWYALSSYGIKILELGGAIDEKTVPDEKERARLNARLALDCGHYVLDQLGFPLNPNMIEGLQKLRRTPQQHADSIVFYRSWGPHGMNIVHYGLYRDGTVKSKWGSGSPILQHSLELVPAGYGQYVEFCSKRTAIETFHLIQQMSLFGD